MKGRFRLDTSIAPLAPAAAAAPTALAPPAETAENTRHLDSTAILRTTFRALPGPTPSRGSFQYDLASGKYNKRWDSWKLFQDWLSRECARKAIEIRLVKTHLNTADNIHSTRRAYMCSRHETGGKKSYSKKNPHWKRKIETKHVGCPCALFVKTYSDTNTVLGAYEEEHNHETGNGNLRHTRIAPETREWIAAKLREHTEPEHILNLLHRGAYNHDDDSAEEDAGPSAAHRNEMIQMSDILKISKQIEAESIRLDPDDGKSVKKWVARLQSKDQLLGFKGISDAVPPGSNLAADTFALMIQTGWQRKMFRKHGENIVCIDGTHNTTVYQDLTLTTLVVRDRWAHGIPVAWMFASSKTEETVRYFLRLVHLKNPDVMPKYIMSDFDWAQINACKAEYFYSLLLLCWWHVLHAWQQHFKIGEHPELWEKLKRWIRLTDEQEFDRYWDDIRRLAPDYFIEYLEKYWMSDKVKRMWSAVYRKNRSVFTACETNMLIEAWHHVVKGKFLHGKRNHRLDHLIHILVNEVVPFYALKQRRQDLGFEGADIEIQKRIDIEKKGATIAIDAIECIEDGVKYLVESQSTRGRCYEVDIEAYVCECLDFPLISYCKHMCAVQRLFPETSDAHISMLDTDSTAFVEASRPDVAAISTLGDPQANSESGDLNYSTTHGAPDAKARTADFAAKLDRLSAWIRQDGAACGVPELVDALEPKIEQALAAMSSNGSGPLLPPRQRVPPNIKTSTETQRVMPRTKTAPKRAGDPSYGGGENSGKKAKKARTTKEKVASGSLGPAPTPQASTASGVVFPVANFSESPQSQSSSSNPTSRPVPQLNDTATNHLPPPSYSYGHPPAGMFHVPPTYAYQDPRTGMYYYPNSMYYPPPQR